MTIVFTRHALDRIEHGDENGRRTILTPQEVADILSSDLAVPFRDGYVFYSLKDGKCLFVVVGRFNNNIVTIFPADRVYWEFKLLAERKALGDLFFRNHIPPVSSYSREESALIGCVISRWDGRRWVTYDQEKFFNWFDFKKNQEALLRSREFLQLVIDALEACARRLGPNLKVSSLLVRTVGWQNEFPASLLYDFLRTPKGQGAT
jgi:hypothetical protein